MIVTCSECSTKFKLDDERIPESGAKVRCSRCQNIFQVQKPAPPEQPYPSIEISREEFEEEPKWKERPSRRFPFLILLIVLLILAGVGYGAFVIWEKSADLKKVTPGFSALRQFLGLSDEKEGSIAIEKLRGYYLENIKSARLFVIEGQAVNHWNESRSFIKVKGTLLDAKGTKVEEKVVYCGNILSEKDLKELPKEAIEKSLSSQFGISFSNVNIPPDKSVPFMIVFTDPPTGAAEEKPGQEPSKKPGEVHPGLSDFTVEVVSSQKGSK